LESQVRNLTKISSISSEKIVNRSPARTPTWAVDVSFQMPQQVESDGSGGIHDLGVRTMKLLLMTTLQKLLWNQKLTLLYWNWIKDFKLNVFVSMSIYIPYVT